MSEGNVMSAVALAPFRVRLGAVGPSPFQQQHGEDALKP